MTAPAWSCRPARSFIMGAGMWLKRIADLIGRIAHPAVSLLKGIAMGILAIMMLLTAVDVIFRYLFNRPITGALELKEFMMSVLVSFGMAYCVAIDGHVSVDIVVMRFPKKIQTIIGCITTFLSLVLFSLVTWQNVLYINEILKCKLESSVLLIPVYPFIGGVAIGFLVLCLALLMNLFQQLSEAIKE